MNKHKIYIQGSETLEITNKPGDAGKYAEIGLDNIIDAITESMDSHYYPVRKACIVHLGYMRRK